MAMGKVDPEFDRSITRAIGHGFPVTSAECESVTELVMQRVRDLGPIADFRSLEQLILVGCDPVSVRQIESLTKLRMLSIEDSALRDLSGVASLPILNFSMPRDFVADIEPLLHVPTLLQVDVTGNPLSDVSYREVIPKLVENGCRVRFSQELEWRVTVHLQTAGVGVACYGSARGYRLCRPGLGLTDAPQYGHPVITKKDAEGLLEGDPEGALRFFS
ncbi:leucine-rich repeat domain-containing protein [Streptomyces mayteni]